MKTKVLTAVIGAAALVLFYQCSDKEEESILQNSTSNPVSAVSSSNPQARTGEVSSGFTEEVGTPISGAAGRRWIKNYRKKNPDGIRSHYFGSKAIMRILSQPNVVGINLTYAINDEGKQQIILIGVDKEGQLVLPLPSDQLVTGDVEMDDVSGVCPPMCVNEAALDQ